MTEAGNKLAAILKEKVVSGDTRLNEPKSISLTMTSGHKPEVSFTGFWTGRDIKAAMNSVARAYRLHRRDTMITLLRPATSTESKPALDGAIKQEASNAR